MVGHNLNLILSFTTNLTLSYTVLTMTILLMFAAPQFGSSLYYSYYLMPMVTLQYYFSSSNTTFTILGDWHNFLNKFLYLFYVGLQSYLWLPFIPLIVSTISNHCLCVLSLKISKVRNMDFDSKIWNTDRLVSRDKATSYHNKDGTEDPRERRGG